MRIRFRIRFGSVDFDSSAMKPLAWLLLASAGAMLPGCSEPTGPKVIASRELSVKIPAIKRAVDQKDMSEAAELVKELDDDDAAVRLFAIEGLQRLTGQRLGYHYYEDKEARKPAVERWNKWLSEQKN